MSDTTSEQDHITNSPSHQGSSAVTSETREARGGLGRDEALLLERVAQGDHEAYEILYREFYPRVWKLIYNYVGTKETTEDLCQDYFASLWKKAAQYRELDPVSLPAFIFRSVRNLCIDHFRRQAHRSGDLPRGETYFPPDPLLQDELASHVRQALSQLPEQQFVAVVLCEVEGLSHREIASIIDTSERGVEGLLYRGRKKLADLLNHYL